MILTIRPLQNSACAFKNYLTQELTTKIKLKEEDQLCFEFRLWLTQKTLQNAFPFVWFHVANEIIPNKNFIFGKKLKKIGKMAGVADYIFLGEKGSFAIEFKSKKGILSPSQKIFKSWCEKNHIPFFCAYTLKDAQEFVLKMVEKFKI